jgi:hypothetical protein
MSAEPETHEAACQIRDYLKGHPQAADTLDGISRWWLKSAIPITSVKAALDHLVMCDELRVSETARGVIYARRER